jgi:hypothetical protein
MDWIELAQDREGPVEGSCEHGDKPSVSLKLLRNFLNGCTIGSFSGGAQLRE